VAEPAAASAAPAPRRGPLGELADRLNAKAVGHADPAAPPPGGVPAPGLPEPGTLEYFRRTWSRLDAGRRLAQALAEVPENAGPINSKQLVHRSLVLMNGLSPAYLQHFLAHADALLWLDEHARGGPAPAAPTSAGGARRGRGKAA
jgi:hypothetical protein